MKIFRRIVITLLSLSISSCINQDQTQVAELTRQMEDLRPGLGEIMLGIQQHHAKLYYAGSAANWELADYELGEIRENLDDAQKLHPQFKEVKEPLTQLIPAMTKPSLRAVAASIQHKSRTEFAESFQALTVSCNQCHQAAGHAFVVIQRPTLPAFTNQKFSP
jgi:cytochrome c553